MTRTLARIARVLGLVALLASATACDRATELLSSDTSPCVVRRIDQIGAGWLGGDAPCLVVTWDTAMIANRADRDADSATFDNVRAAGYGGPACGLLVPADAPSRPWFASRFGRLTERASEWHADLFLLAASPQPQICDGYFDQ